MSMLATCSAFEALQTIDEILQRVEIKPGACERVHASDEHPCNEYDGNRFSAGDLKLEWGHYRGTDEPIAMFKITTESKEGHEKATLTILYSVVPPSC